MNANSSTTSCQSEQDEYWMRKALQLAEKAWGQTHPNPMVGAVLVYEGKEIGSGWHKKAGEAHAEVEALREFSGGVPQGTTLYITLEPCSSQGRTPPCTKRILECGVRRVVIGCEDPDVRHRGRGVKILRVQGVDVLSGILSAECQDLNLAYHYRLETNKPLIAAKIATTIDGKVGLSNGESQWITGAESRQDVHRWRRYFQAIGVGAGTVLADDPSLTARDRMPEACPLRLIFDRSGTLLRQMNQRVFTDSYHSRTYLFTEERHIASFQKQLAGNIQVELLPHTKEQMQSWLLQADCNGLYIEGGSRIFSDFIRKGWIDYLFAYRAPKLFLDPGSISCGTGDSILSIKDSLNLHAVQHLSLGEDQLLRGFVSYPQTVKGRQ